MDGILDVALFTFGSPIQILFTPCVPIRRFCSVDTCCVFCRLGIPVLFFEGKVETGGMVGHW